MKQLLMILFFSVISGGCAALLSTLGVEPETAAEVEKQTIKVVTAAATASAAVPVLSPIAGILALMVAGLEAGAVVIRGLRAQKGA